jgi:hypothetical protein
MTDHDDMPDDPFPPVARTGLGAAGVGVPDGRGHVILVNVEAIPLNLDGPDLSQWCATCLLPSAVGYRFRVLANGVALPGELTIEACRDCGQITRRKS